MAFIASVLVKWTTCGLRSQTYEKLKTYIKQKGKSNILITKAMFNRYREVQYDGAWNMMMDWPEAAADAELSPVSYWTILNNYSDLARHYGEMEKNNG